MTKRKNKTGKMTLANKILESFKCLTGKPLNKKGRNQSKPRKLAKCAWSKRNDN